MGSPIEVRARSRSRLSSRLRGATRFGVGGETNQRSKKPRTRHSPCIELSCIMYFMYQGFKPHVCIVMYL